MIMAEQAHEFYLEPGQLLIYSALLQNFLLIFFINYLFIFELLKILDAVSM